jgi:hypothetical protein
MKFLVDKAGLFVVELKEVIQFDRYRFAGTWSPPICLHSTSRTNSGHTNQRPEKARVEEEMLNVFFLVPTMRENDPVDSPEAPGIRSRGNCFSRTCWNFQ